jgi:hypothetical protein
MKLIKFPGPQTWKTSEPTLTIFATGMHKGFPCKETAEKLCLKATLKTISWLYSSTGKRLIDLQFLFCYVQWTLTTVIQQ